MNTTISKEVRHAAVVAPEMSLDAFTAPRLRDELNQLFSNNICKIVIDLAHVTFIDSAGMAVLVNALKNARSADGDVRLVWPQEEEARRIFYLTKFHHVFGMAATADAALAAF